MARRKLARRSERLTQRASSSANVLPRASRDRYRKYSSNWSRMTSSVPPTAAVAAATACSSPAFGDAGTQQRALADAALGVEEGQPGGAQVADDPLALRLAPEEERCVLLRVVGEPDVRAVGGGGCPPVPGHRLRHRSARARPACASRRSSSAT